MAGWHRAWSTRFSAPTRARCTACPERGRRIMSRGGRVLASALALQASGAAAQPVADFYRGKSIDLIIASTVGGGYDAYSRVLAPFLTKNLPGNPRLVPKNMT